MDVIDVMWFILTDYLKRRDFQNFGGPKSAGRADLW